MHPSRLLLLSSFALLTPLGTARAQVTLPYDAPQILATDRQQIVLTLDLDGDGDQDAMGWWLDGPAAPSSPGNQDNGKLHGWLNDGTGKLELAWDVPYVGHYDTTIPRETIGSNDFDGDGDADWALVAGDRLRIFLSNGALPPTLWIDVPMVGDHRALVIANFDASDSARELAVASEDGWITVYDVQTDSASLQLLSTRDAGVPIVGPLVGAEFTGDGTADLLVSGARVFPVVGGVIQPLGTDFGLAADPATYMFAHDVGDLDGDGDVDAVTFAMNGAGDAIARVLRRTSSTTLTVEPAYAGGPARKLADIDGDGDLDGVCCTSGGGGPSGYYNHGTSVFRIALNDGTGQFAPAFEWPGLGSMAIAGAVDLDGDDDLDLVAGRTVHYAQGPWVGQPLQDPGDIAPRSPWTGDVDGDGDLDLDLHLGGYKSNRGDGIFKQRTLTLPAPPPNMARIGDGYVADWDGDGDPDMLAAIAAPGGGQGAMELLLNTAPGRFESAGVVDWTLVEGSEGLARRSLNGDLDGDGDLDLVVDTQVTVSGNTNHVWHNAGAAGFQYMGDVPGAYAGNLADLDGDGRLDLVGGLPTHFAMRWAANLGNGSFAPWVVIPGVELKPEAIPDLRPRFVTEDLDSDGDVDISTWFYNGSTSQVRVWWNDGGMDFTPQNLSPLMGGSQLGALAFDVHGNGKLDLVVGPLSNALDSVAVLLRSSDNTSYLPARSQVLLESYPGPLWRMNLAAGDLDGDGDPELVGHRLADDMRFDGPSSGQRLQIGAGIAGQGAIAPLLGAEGPFRVGVAVRLRLSGLRPGSTGVLTVTGVAAPPRALSSGQLGRPQAGFVLKPLHITASGTNGDPLGSGTWEHTFEVAPNLAGSSYQFQATLSDPDAPAGSSKSNLLYLTYGN